MYVRLYVWTQRCREVTHPFQCRFVVGDIIMVWSWVPLSLGQVVLDERVPNTGTRLIELHLRSQRGCLFRDIWQCHSPNHFVQECETPVSNCWLVSQEKSLSCFESTLVGNIPNDVQGCVR